MLAGTSGAPLAATGLDGGGGLLLADMPGQQVDAGRQQERDRASDVLRLAGQLGRLVGMAKESQHAAESAELADI